MHDIEFKGVYAQGVYSGDVYDTGGGMIEMTFYDEKGDAGEPFGYAVKLTVIGPKFLDPKKERKLTPARTRPPRPTRRIRGCRPPK